MRVLVLLVVAVACLAFLAQEAEATGTLKAAFKKAVTKYHLTKNLKKLNTGKGEGSSFHIVAPTYRTQKYDKVPAGASMGNEKKGKNAQGHDQNFYWTLGAHLCEATSGDVFGLTNGHNQDNCVKDDVVNQPSKLETGSRAVGKWIGIMDDMPFPDAAVFKFDTKDLADAGKVLGPAGKLLNVKGTVTNAEIAKWPTDGSKKLYVSGRMCGWSGVLFLKAAADTTGLIDPKVKLIYTTSFTTQGSEAWSTVTGGNSGSGLFDLDPNGNDVKLVGIFNNGDVVPAIEDVLNWVNEQRTSAGDPTLTVCTA